MAKAPHDFYSSELKRTLMKFILLCLFQ